MTHLTEAILADGAWKAVIDEEYYEGPLVNWTTAVVRLVSIHDPTRAADVLGVSANTADERPAITWTAPRTLQVDAPSSVCLKVLTREFEGVRIDIQLPPEDAANRAAYFRQTGDPDPDPGGVLA